MKEGQRVGQLYIEPNGVIVNFIGRRLYLNLQIVSKLSTGKLYASLGYELLVSVENSPFFELCFFWHSVDQQLLVLIKITFPSPSISFTDKCREGNIFSCKVNYYR